MHQTGDQKVIRSSTPPLTDVLRARRWPPRSVPTAFAQAADLLMTDAGDGSDLRGSRIRERGASRAPTCAARSR